MTHQAHPSVVREAVQVLAEHGFDGMAQAMELFIRGLVGKERGHACAALLRLVTAVLMELSEEWETGKRYVTFETK